MYDMNSEDYKRIIIQMFQYLDNADNLFLKQIYTLVRKHIEQKGRDCN